MVTHWTIGIGIRSTFTSGTWIVSLTGVYVVRWRGTCDGLGHVTDHRLHDGDLLLDAGRDGAIADAGRAPPQCPQPPPHWWPHVCPQVTTGTIVVTGTFCVT